MIKNNKINTLKIGLIGLATSLALLAVPTLALAVNITYSAANDVLLTTPNTTVTISSGSNATSVVVNVDSIDVVVPVSDSFTITSRNLITVTPDSGSGGSGSTVVQTCSGTTNTTVVTTTAASAGTYNLATNGGVCTASSGGGGGGGGGGSSSTSSATTTTTTTTTTTPTAIPGCNGTAGFSTSTGQSCAANTAAAASAITGTSTSTSTSSATSATASSATFSVAKLGTITLKNGSKGDSVKELQKVLNKVLKTNLVVDGKLGPKTIATIKKWQKDHGLKADGLVGKLTKAAMVTEANK